MAGWFCWRRLQQVYEAYIIYPFLVVGIQEDIRVGARPDGHHVLSRWRSGWKIKNSASENISDLHGISSFMCFEKQSKELEIGKRQGQRVPNKKEQI